jgi:hypothetical protein
VPVRVRQCRGVADRMPVAIRAAPQVRTDATTKRPAVLRYFRRGQAITTRSVDADEPRAATAGIAAGGLLATLYMT